MTAEILVKHVEPLHVLSVRKWLGDQSEVARELASLLPSVADILSGPPMALRLGFPQDGQAQFDLAFPVRESVEREGFEVQVLPALPMFSITHEGSIAGGPEGTNLADSWQSFAKFVGERGVLAGDDPARFVYRGGLDTANTDEERFVLEVQYPYHMPMWIEAFEKGVTGCMDEDAAARVLSGSEGLAEALDGEKAAAWVQVAVERFDREVADEGTRARVLNACAHHYIVQSALTLKAAWDESEHDLRALVQQLSDEPILGGKYWLDESGETPLLCIQRRPARQEAYDQATDPVEKRYQACFCPLVRDAIREGKPVSRTFCHCSSGWYVQEWETVFGEPPRVDLVETMLEGADACVFAVHVPPGFL